jgi:hypothetical protein
MKMACFRLETLTIALCVAAGAGCIIEPDDDDANASGETGGPDTNSGPISTSGDNSISSTNDDGTGTSPTTGDPTDTGDLPDDCDMNLFEDPGFEGGTPSDVWAEASEVFGTPICNAGCSEEQGAEPYAGDWWVWFGGIEQMDTASVSQTIAIDPERAILQFRFWVNAGADAGEDVFYVDIDTENVFMATNADELVYDGYTLVEVDVSDFADGGMHTVTFGAELTGQGLTNFFLDNVLLVSCSEGAGSTTTGPMTDTDTDTATTMGDTDTGEPTSTGSDTGDGTAGTAGG